MGTFLDLTGMKFGRLTILSRHEDRIEGNGRKRIYWDCKCDCGNNTVVCGENLKRGATTSCGCYKRECTSKRASTHRDTNTHLYGIWCSMKARCYNKNTKYYDRYGGRGIDICDQWKNDYESFKDWSVKNGYSDGLSIDRINNDRGYSPDNCRWISMKEQANNRSSNRLITFQGETHNLTEWAEILNINPKTLFTRLYNGWSVERMLSVN